MRTVAACCSVVVGLVLGGACLAQAEVTLQVQPVQGGVDLDFGDAKSLGWDGEAESDMVFRQLRVIITSTSGARYQLFQRVNDAWVNERGEAFPLEAVRFFVSETKTDGIVRFPTPTPMSEFEEEMFLSNAAGEDENFLITYTVQVPVGQMAGRYRANLTFRLVSQ